jgi:hypothetical protein
LVANGETATTPPNKRVKRNLWLSASPQRVKCVQCVLSDKGICSECLNS